MRLYEEFTNHGRQELLDSLSDFSLAKAYHSLFTVSHWGCRCFRCELQNDCLQTLMKRGRNAVFLSECFDDKFVEVEKPTSFFDEYFEKKTKVVRGRLQQK